MVKKILKGGRSLVKKILKRRRYRESFKRYAGMYAAIVERSPGLGLPAEGEEEWMERWRRYDGAIGPECYRIFSRFGLRADDIVPLDLLAAVVEPILTPAKYQTYYSDKNLYDKLLGGVRMPRVLLRNIGGLFYDEEYRLVEPERVDDMIAAMAARHGSVIVKPSNGSSGRGVQMFRSRQDGFVNGDGERLDLAMLRSAYLCDFLIQERIGQSDAIAFFNESSLNTLRVTTYRDERGGIHYLSCGMRIGAKGAVVDNAHAGGAFCGIAPDGKVGGWVCDQHGVRRTEYNGRRFEGNGWYIPNFDRVKAFALEAAKEILHHDLIAFDIALDRDDNPILVEFNVGGFGSWFFLMGGQTIFGEWAEEIFERCMRQYRVLDCYIFSSAHKNRCLRNF